MNPAALSYFYRYEGKTKLFLKSYFIRVIRNRLIDPNTSSFLHDGFNFFDENTKTLVAVPCDDSNWCEYCTFNEGFKLDVLKFPFSLKLHNNYFIEMKSYDEFIELFKKVIEFRNDIIKRGWAIKYGFEFQGNDYPELEELTEEQLLIWKDPRPKARYSLDDIEEAWLK